MCFDVITACLVNTGCFACSLNLMFLTIHGNVGKAFRACGATLTVSASYDTREMYVR